MQLGFWKIPNAALQQTAPCQRQDSFAPGWSLLAVNSVVRPVESVDWNGFPMSPALKNVRSGFTRNA